MQETETVTVTPVKDFLGKEISCGDRIVYPGRKGSDLWMTTGKVLAINFRDGSIWVETGSGRLRDIKRTDRVVVVG